MTKKEFLALREIAERNGYGYVQQLMTGLWSFENEQQDLYAYDVPVAMIQPMTEPERRKDIDIARYAVRMMENL